MAKTQFHQTKNIIGVLEYLLDALIQSHELLEEMESYPPPYDIKKQPL